MEKDNRSPYRWNGTSPSRLYSSHSKNRTHKGDVQKWLMGQEEESSYARLLGTRTDERADPGTSYCRSGNVHSRDKSTKGHSRLDDLLAHRMLNTQAKDETDEGMFHHRLASAPARHKRNEGTSYGKLFSAQLEDETDEGESYHRLFKPHAMGRKHRHLKPEVTFAAEEERIREAAYAEAQDLLDQWTAERVSSQAAAAIDQTWTSDGPSNLFEYVYPHEDDQLDASDTESEIYLSKYRQPKNEIRSENVETEAKFETENVVQKLLAKKYVQADAHTVSAAKRKINMDPRIRMDIRRKQVKENREKQMREREIKLKEEQERKEAEFEARRELKREEQEKAAFYRREEEAIQQEMIRVRKALRKEMIDKQRNYLDSVDKPAHPSKHRAASAQYAEHGIAGEHRIARVRSASTTKHSRDEFLQPTYTSQEYIQKKKSLEELEHYFITRRNYRVKQSAFSTWYYQMLERGLKLKKAQAYFEWHSLYKGFNAWKAIIYERKLEQETQLFKEKLTRDQRQINKADDFHRWTLLRRYMTMWELHTNESIQERALQHEQQNTRAKMASFLNAASSGRLWKDTFTQNEEQRHIQDELKTSNGVFIFTGKKPTSKEAKTSQKPNPTSSESPTHKKITEGKSGKKESAGTKVTKPDEAWQVTRRHLQLTAKDIIGSKADGLGYHPRASQSNVELGDQDKKRLAQKAFFLPNAFEHRHAAQQKLLEQQQKQIQDQQKLIEELQYLQRQQLLQQELLAQRLTQPNSDIGTVQGSINHLQKHIENIEHALAQHEDIRDDNGRIKGKTHRTQSLGLASRVPIYTKTKIETEPSQAEEEGSPRERPRTRSGRKNGVQSRTSSAARDQPTTKREQSRSRQQSETHVRSSLSPERVKKELSKVNPKHREFLKTMEARAAERNRLRQEREERKRQQELQKLREKVEQQEREKQAEEEERQARIQEAYERKRQEKEKEEQKIRLREHMKKMHEEAISHHNQSLMKYWGWLPWRKMMANLHAREDDADNHFRITFVRKHFEQWTLVVRQEVEERNTMARDYNVFRLERKYYRKWEAYVAHSQELYCKAQDHHDYKILVRSLAHWRSKVEERAIVVDKKMQYAAKIYNRNLVTKCFLAIRMFRVTEQEQKEKQSRIKDMRSKVANLLPDYVPPRSTRNSVNVLEGVDSTDSSSLREQIDSTTNH